MNLAAQETFARHVYAAVFGQPANERVIGRYLLASAEIAKTHDPSERAEFETALQTCRNVTDFRSLEFAARVKKRLPLFTKHFRIMVYLGECEPQLRSQLVNNVDRPFVAWWTMTWGILRDFYLLGRGLWLLKKLKENP